jgi:cytochrome bd-type quinol oxidase subunit 2
LVVAGAGLFRGFPETVAASGSVVSLPILLWVGLHAAARFTAYQQLSIRQHPPVDNSSS